MVVQTLKFYNINSLVNRLGREHLSTQQKYLVITSSISYQRDYKLFGQFLKCLLLGFCLVDCMYKRGLLNMAHLSKVIYSLKIIPSLLTRIMQSLPVKVRKDS